MAAIEDSETLVAAALKAPRRRVQWSMTVLAFAAPVGGVVPAILAHAPVGILLLGLVLVGAAFAWIVAKA